MNQKVKTIGLSLIFAGLAGVSGAGIWDIYRHEREDKDLRTNRTRAVLVAADLHDIQLGAINKWRCDSPLEYAVEFKAKDSSGAEKRGVVCVEPRSIREPTIHYPKYSPGFKP